MGLCVFASQIRRPAPVLTTGLDRSLRNSPPDCFLTFAPFRVRVPTLISDKKTKHCRQATVFCFWRRAWDSNPRGCYTLLAFQASSLATRSILHMANCCFLFSSATVNRLPHMATLCKQNFLFFCIFLFCGRKLPSEPCRKQS